jgi:hypothetical protein
MLAGDTVSLDFEPTLLAYATGLYVAVSSTQSTYTATSASDASFHVDYAAAVDMTTRTAAREGGSAA